MMARRIIGSDPLALCLDLDDLRTTIPGWLDDQRRAGRVTPARAIELARELLGAAHDVVIPQLLVRPELMDALAELADAATPEANSVPGYKEALLRTHEDGTTITRAYTGKRRAA